MNAEVVFTISPEGLKRLHKEAKPSLHELYEWLDTAETKMEFDGYQIWEWLSLEWGEEIHNVLRHALAAIPAKEFRLITLDLETNDLTDDGTMTGPFDVMSGSSSQGFPTNWIHVDLGYVRHWQGFDDSGSLAPLGLVKQG